MGIGIGESTYQRLTWSAVTEPRAPGDGRAPATRLPVLSSPFRAVQRGAGRRPL